MCIFIKSYRSAHEIITVFLPSENYDVMCKYDVNCGNIASWFQEGDSEDGLPSANAGRQTNADER